MIIVYLLIGVKFGFSSKFMEQYGTLLGTGASLLVYAQYLPQIMTTFILKSSGSLSILMLEIQAPGGALNALFMWIGQGHHWSTWISLLLASIQQFILLGICLFYRKRKIQIHQIKDDSSIEDEFNFEADVTERLPENFVMPIIKALEKQESE